MAAVSMIFITGSHGLRYGHQQIWPKLSRWSRRDLSEFSSAGPSGTFQFKNPKAEWRFQVNKVLSAVAMLGTCLRRTRLPWRPPV